MTLHRTQSTRRLVFVVVAFAIAACSQEPGVEYGTNLTQRIPIDAADVVGFVVRSSVQMQSWGSTLVVDRVWME